MRRPICPCKFEGSGSIDIRGTGNPDDQYRAYYKLSEDEGNGLVRSPNGLRLLIPSQVQARPAVKAIADDDLTFDDNFPVAIPFTDVLYDTGGIWDGEDTFIIPRAGLWSVGGFMTIDGDEAIDAQVSIQVNDLRRIAQEGPRTRDVAAVPPMSADISTQYVFEVGDRLKMYLEPFGVDGEEGAFVRQDRYFYATFRGD